VPYIYGNNIIIKGELYFWAIFYSDLFLGLTKQVSTDSGIEHGWEILSSLQRPKVNKEIKSNATPSIHSTSTKLDKGKEVENKSTSRNNIE
jgi:hypothetical protein